MISRLLLDEYLKDSLFSLFYFLPMCHKSSREIKSVPFDSRLSRQIAPLAVGQNVNQQISEITKKLFSLGETQHRRFSVVGSRKRQDQSSDGIRTCHLTVRFEGNEPTLRSARVSLVVSDEGIEEKVSQNVSTFFVNDAKQGDVLVPE